MQKGLEAQSERNNSTRGSTNGWKKEASAHYSAVILISKWNAMKSTRTHYAVVEARRRSIISARGSKFKPAANSTSRITMLLKTICVAGGVAKFSSPTRQRENNFNARPCRLHFPDNLIDYARSVIQSTVENSLPRWILAGAMGIRLVEFLSLDREARIRRCNGERSMVVNHTLLRWAWSAFGAYLAAARML